MTDDGGFAVGQRVQVQLDGKEPRGTIVEDFGGTPGLAVDVGATRIAEPSRRWAVQLDGGRLIFADTVDLRHG